MRISVQIAYEDEYGLTVDRFEAPGEQANRLAEQVASEIRMAHTKGNIPSAVVVEGEEE